MKHRIVEERGKVWNYKIQARIVCMWLPVGNVSTLEYARDMAAKLEGGTKHVVPNAEVSRDER